MEPHGMRVERGSEGGGRRNFLVPIPTLKREPKNWQHILLKTFGTKNRSTYVVEPVWTKQFPNDGIESTQRYNGFLSDEKYEKSWHGNPLLVWFIYIFLRAKYPKIAEKSVRPFLLVKHTVPTLTDEDKVTICVEKVCFPREKKSVGEHPLIKSKGAVFRRSEDVCAIVRAWHHFQCLKQSFLILKHFKLFVFCTNSYLDPFISCHIFDNS